MTFSQFSEEEQKNCRNTTFLEEIESTNDRLKGGRLVGGWCLGVTNSASLVYQVMFVFAQLAPEKCMLTATIAWGLRTTDSAQGSDQSS
jgi:hypothetical protein